MSANQIRRPPKRTRRPPKRTRRTPDDAKFLILEAAKRVMLEEGYAAVGTRRAAEIAGVSPTLIHY